MRIYGVPVPLQGVDKKAARCVRAVRGPSSYLRNSKDCTARGWRTSLDTATEPQKVPKKFTAQWSSSERSALGTVETEAHI
jgi:hypothetical protein